MIYFDYRVRFILVIV